MFSITVDDYDYTFLFTESSNNKLWFLYLYKDDKFNKYVQGLSFPVVKSGVHWGSGSILKNTSTEDGMWIPDAVKDYITRCHQRYFNLLVFS